jgi:hypothetical protein
MILVLGNFAGVFSNLCKFLNWSLLLQEEDTILFYYTNKFKDNQDPTVTPFENYENDISRVFFYRYFEYPKGCNQLSFLQKDRFELKYPEIPSNSLPTYLHAYPNAFIYTDPKIYFDPNFPLIRQLYFSHLSKRLVFTPYMKSFFEDELSMIQMLQSEGKKVLAVMIRWTNHYREGCNIESVFDEIHEIQKDYDVILPLTQVKPFYNRLIETYGRKCIFLSRNRLDEDQDWWYNTTDEPFEDEFRMAIADVYLASQCDFIISGASNMLLGALFFHPTVPFKIYKELSTKKTG